MTFDILEIRKRWNYHLNEATNETHSLAPILVELDSIKIKQIAMREFFKYLLDATDETTTKETLIVLLEEMQNNHIIPEDEINIEFYNEKWVKLILIERNRLVQR